MDILTRLALACIASAVLTPFSIAQTLLPTTSSVSCSFDKHSAVKPPKGSASDFKKASTYLAFTEGKTSAKTWKLDGAIRATNSNMWFEPNRSRCDIIRCICDARCLFERPFVQ